MNGQSPDDHTEACVAAPSGIDVVDAFVACLALCLPDEREMMIDYLRSKVCILCGAPDPDCPCWSDGAEVADAN